MLKFERDLAKQIQALLDQYHETQKELRLSPENIQKVVEVALEAGRAAAAGPTECPASGPTRADGMPGLPAAGPAGKLGGVCRGAGPPAHGETAPDRLRPCRGEGPGRRGAGPPEPPAGADVPAAAAGRGLVATPAARSCTGSTARVVPDHALATPAVIAHARLVVIGGDSHRLHEEIITAGGYLEEGRFTRMNVGPGRRRPWPRPTDEEPSEPTKKRLLELWAEDRSLAPEALEARMKDRTKGLKKSLHERADKEAGDIRVDPDGIEAVHRGGTGRTGVRATGTVQRPGAGAVRAEQGLPCGTG